MSPNYKNKIYNFYANNFNNCKLDKIIALLIKGEIDLLILIDSIIKG